MEQNHINTMYIAISHKPVSNKISMDFCKSFGFKKISEIKNDDNHVWGIYRLELK